MFREESEMKGKRELSQPPKSQIQFCTNSYSINEVLKMSKNKEYDIYKITLDEYTTYNICVPKGQLEEFEKWKQSKDVIISEWVGETGNDAMCCTVFDHGYEFPDGCDEPLYLEEE